MTKRCILATLILVFVFSGCNIFNRVVKDIPIQEMDDLREKYIGRAAWTRSLIIDLKSQDIIDRDIQVEIVDLDMHWNGAVTVKGPKRRRITHGLGLERPLTKMAVEEGLTKLFWFRKPEYRYRMDLRQYGKRTAKAIYNHELFKGMKRDAALESWGFPDEVKSNEIGGVLEEQWIFKDPRVRTKKRYVFIRDGLVDAWED